MKRRARPFGNSRPAPRSTSNPPRSKARSTSFPRRAECSALDGQTGDQRWFAPNIVQFCSVSALHVYAIDHLDRLAILDIQRGTRLSTLPVGNVQMKLLNQQTDRIYLASDAGVVQCLHELSQPKALVYTPPRLNRKSGKSEKRKRDEAKADSDAAEEKAGEAKPVATNRTSRRRRRHAGGEEGADAKDPLGLTAAARGLMMDQPRPGWTRLHLAQPRPGGRSPGCDRFPAGAR